jgi:hypothetical protein
MPYNNQPSSITSGTAEIHIQSTPRMIDICKLCRNHDTPLEFTHNSVAQKKQPKRQEQREHGNVITVETKRKKKKQRKLETTTENRMCVVKRAWKRKQNSHTPRPQSSYLIPCCHLPLALWCHLAMQCP